MVKGYYQEVSGLLKDRGFEYVGNAKGSHEKWHNAETDITVTVPFNMMSRHTANKILKDAGINHKF